MDRFVNNHPFSPLLLQLNTLSPSDIVQDEIALGSFHQFLGRDSAATCWELLPESHKPLLVSASRSARRTASTRSRSQPKRVSQAQITNDDIAQYFKSRIKDGVKNGAERVAGLVRAVRGALEAEQLDDDAYEKIWSSKDGIFAQRVPGRQRMLYLGRNTIIKRSSECSAADRITLLYVAAEIAWAHPREKSKLPRGRGPLTIALEQVSKQAGVSTKILKEDRSRSENYYRLIERAGLGSILELGQDVGHSWEKRMHAEDVDLFLEYRDLFLPQLASRAQRLNIIASRIIIKGLIVYGWKWEELLLPYAPMLVQQIDLQLRQYSSSLRQIKDSIEGGQQLSTTNNRKKRAGDDLEQHPAKRGRTRDDGDIAHHNEMERLVPQAQYTINTVPCTPVAVSCLPPSLGYNPQIGQEFYQTGGLGDIPLSFDHDPQVLEAFYYQAGGLSDMPLSLDYDPQALEAFYQAGSLSDIALSLNYDPQVFEAFYQAGGLF